MREPYEIYYAESAKSDLFDIFQYMKNDSPGEVLSRFEKFDRSVSQLAQSPFLGLIPKDGRLKNLGYRMLIVDNCILFYIARARTIQIRCVIQGVHRYGFLI